MNNIYFVTGIDTDIGKTYACGWLAKQWQTQEQAKEHRVITQKMVQTGCKGVADDILLHRRIQGIKLTPEDHAGLTMPYIFSYPCSPHMAAARDGIVIDTAVIDHATHLLASRYERVLIEGAGGLCVPLTDDITLLDYLAKRCYPTILVTGPKLGSINHTLLSLQVLKQHQIPVHALIYNEFGNYDSEIAANTKQYLQQYLTKHYAEADFLILPRLVGYSHVNNFPAQ